MQLEFENKTELYFYEDFGCIILNHNDIRVEKHTEVRKQGERCCMPAGGAGRICHKMSPCLPCIVDVVSGTHICLHIYRSLWLKD